MVQELFTLEVINIRYALIRNLDISNGEGVGVALFVQGCPSPHCRNCFNPETWDFNGGKEWTEETESKFIELASKPYIKHISILGGEPLADENLDGVLHLVNRICLLSSKKTIWLYTRYSWDEIMNYKTPFADVINAPNSEILYDYLLYDYHMFLRKKIISQCDVLVDGRYIDSERDITLKWRGSRNQSVIDVQQSLKQNKIVLYCD